MYRVAVSDVCAAAQSAVCTSKVPLKNSVDTYTASAKRKDAARCLQGVGACGRISPARGDKLRLRTSSIKKQHPFGCCFFGACGRIRTGDRWLLVRMDAGAFRLIFWHSSQYLCSSILHNHALVDAYPISLCKRGNSRHTKTDKQFTAPVYASKVIDSMVPALAKFNAWLYVSFPSRTIFFVSSRDALAIIARSVMTTPAGYPPKLPLSAHRIL